MSFNSLNSLIDKAISVANVAGKKTEEVVEASKLKIQEVSLNSELEECYEQLGSIVYRSRKSGIDSEEEIAQYIEKVDALLVQLQELQLKREEIKKMKKCPNCGASCSIDSHFCSRCGMVISEEKEEEPEQVEAEQVNFEETASEQLEEKMEEPLIEETL